MEENQEETQIQKLYFADILVKQEQLLKNYSDGLIFLKDVEPSFHADFCFFAVFWEKTDGLAEEDIQKALSDIDTYTQWESQNPETYLSCSPDSIGHFDDIKEDILLFFDAYFRGDVETQKRSLFGSVGSHPIIKNLWVAPEKQKSWNEFCSSILDKYHKSKDESSIYLDLHIWKEIERK